jgi:hypothetical protein
MDFRNQGFSISEAKEMDPFRFSTKTFLKKVRILWF